MTKKEFLEQLENETSFKDAEKLASKFSHSIVKSEWRIGYDTIRSNHLNSLGWKTMGINRTKENESFIIELGFTKCFDFYINVKKKQMVKFSDYGRDLPYVSISNGRSYTPPPSCILTLSDYKQILISEVEVLLQKREEMKTFVRGLVDDFKSEIEEMNNKSIEQEIIEKALEEARKKGLIPDKLEKTNYVNF